MAETKNIILITGANSGIGFELAQQLLSNSTNHVLLGSRSVEKGEGSVKELQSRNLPGTVELLQIDITSDTSVAAAVKTIESKHHRLDVLVNNAGIETADGPLAQTMMTVFKTNAVGPHLLAEAFVPLLRKSNGTPRIINISSGAGSISRLQENPTTYMWVKALPYRVSKSALNMVTTCQAIEYGVLGFKVFAYCPGFVISNIGSLNKAEKGAKPTSTGAEPLIKIIAGERDKEHGKFLHGSGQYTW